MLNFKKTYKIINDKKYIGRNVEIENKPKEDNFFGLLKNVLAKNKYAIRIAA